MFTSGSSGYGILKSPSLNRGDLRIPFPTFTEGISGNDILAAARSAAETAAGRPARPAMTLGGSETVNRNRPSESEVRRGAGRHTETDERTEETNKHYDGIAHSQFCLWLTSLAMVAITI